VALDLGDDPMSESGETVDPSETIERIETGETPHEVRSWGWHLLQVSSWILVVMLPIHLYTTWLLHDPGRFGVGLLVDRWRSGAWRMFDWAFVILALLHGGLGLNGVVGARVTSSRARTLVAVAIVVVLGGLAVAVSGAMVRFDLG
jgi:succinate dehydrogenase hydrophobic anchor subunit